MKIDRHIAVMLGLALLLALALRVHAQDTQPVPEKGWWAAIADIWKWDTDEMQTYIKKNHVSVGKAKFCGATIIQGKQYITDEMAVKMTVKDLYGRTEAQILTAFKVQKIETIINTYKPTEK